MKKRLIQFSTNIHISPNQRYHALSYMQNCCINDVRGSLVQTPLDLTPLKCHRTLITHSLIFSQRGWVGIQMIITGIIINWKVFRLNTNPLLVRRWRSKSVWIQLVTKKNVKVFINESLCESWKKWSIILVCNNFTIICLICCNFIIKGLKPPNNVYVFYH